MEKKRLFTDEELKEMRRRSTFPVELPAALFFAPHPLTSAIRCVITPLYNRAIA
ncbi:MAG: hypothetical protein HYU29_00640 [Chloroflexi bacterium]|nr:hypothetical protein [Chloroflexota bacterium]